MESKHFSPFEPQPEFELTEKEHKVEHPEARFLPDDPERMTWHGRYEALNQKVGRLIHLESLAGRGIRGLDFGAGKVEPFSGSPTTQDLCQFLTDKQLKPNLVSVDIANPEQIERDNQYPIEYQREIPKGKFSIIRCLRVIEHLQESDYLKIRKRLLKSLKNGGLFICSNQAKFYHQSSDDWYELPPIIKVLQKRDNELVPIVLFPDTVVPWTGPKSHSLSLSLIKDPEEYNKLALEEYNNFRREILSGERELKSDSDFEGYKKTIDWLSDHLPLQTLAEDEKAKIIEFKRTDPSVFNRQLHQNADEARGWFKRSI